MKRKFSFLLLVLITCTIQARAQLLPNSELLFDLSEMPVKANLRIPVKELHKVLIAGANGSVDSFDVDNTPLVKQYILEHFHAKDSAGNQWAVTITDISRRPIEKQDQLFISLVLRPVNDTGSRSFILAYDAILHQVITHNTLVMLKSATDGGNNSMVTVIKRDLTNNSVPPVLIKQGETQEAHVINGLNNPRNARWIILVIVALVICAYFLLKKKVPSPQV